MNIRQQDGRGRYSRLPQQNLACAFLCLRQTILPKQRLAQKQMPLPGVAVHINRSPQDALRLRVRLPVAQQRSQRKLWLRVAASAQVYCPLQSLLCLIPAAQLQVSHTNLVISLIVIWESIRSLLEMSQTSLGIVLLQSLHTLRKFVTRFSRHLEIAHRDGVAGSLHWSCSCFAKRDDYARRASLKAHIHPLLHRFITLLVDSHNDRACAGRWSLKTSAGIRKRSCDAAPGHRSYVHPDTCRRLRLSVDHHRTRYRGSRSTLAIQNKLPSRSRD